MPGFALMPYGKDQHGVLVFFKAVEGQVTCPSLGYHQLTQFMLDGTANQGGVNNPTASSISPIVSVAAKGSASIRKSVSLSRSASTCFEKISFAKA